MKCNYLSNSLHIDINGNVFPCTITTSNSAACLGNINITSLEEIYNNRAKDINCKDFCSRCLKYKKSYKDWNEDTHDYYFLDIRFDNNCNFMCRMCYGENSVSFKKEDNTVKPKSIISQLYKNFAFINKFRRIYIGGGEPFLSPSIATFLEMLSKDKTIMLSSNISIVKQELIDVLKQFRKVIFYPSIDGLDEVGEYIRYGFKTEIFFKNLQLLQSYFECIPVITVSALNLLTLNKLIKKLGEYVDKNLIYINILDYPSEFHVSVLPSYLKDLYNSRIKSVRYNLNEYFYCDTPFNLYHGLVNIDMALSKSTSLDFNKMKNTLSATDKIRNQDYRVLFGGDV